MIDIDFGDFMLRSDEHNYVVGKPFTVKTGKKKGNIELKKCRYFSSIDNAILDLLQRRLRKTDSATLGELKTALADAKNELNKEINKHFNMEVI